MNTIERPGAAAVSGTPHRDRGGGSNYNVRCFFFLVFHRVGVPCWWKPEAPGSPPITPDIDIRDRILDSELMVSDIGYHILVGFYAFWKV